jgi:hypothetical protein
MQLFAQDLDRSTRSQHSKFAGSASPVSAESGSFVPLLVLLQQLPLVIIC